MERLVKDAAKIDKSINSNSLSFDNIVKAIHAVQENMGITGTTAKEASSTIQGSLSSMKSAWGNLLTSFIVGGDSLDQCIDNFVDATMTFLDNLMPALEKGLSGIGVFIERIAPILEEKFPVLVDKLLPPLLKAATSLVKGLIIALPSIIKTIIQELPDIFKEVSLAIAEAFGMGKSVFDKIGNFFSENAEKVKTFGGVLLGLIGSLMIFIKVKSTIDKISSLFGKSGGSSGKSKSLFGGIFDKLANLKPQTIVKALGNIALIVGGLTLISSIFIPIANELAKGADLKEILKVVAVISILGLVGSAFAWISGIIGKIPIFVVVKGLANMAIMIGGLTALLAIINWAMSSVDIDTTKILTIAGLITVLGTVGSVLSIFSGIVGIIPIPIVLSGLANIALVIGGLTALIAAYGALGKIEGFNDFISTGGDTLANLFAQIGKIAGSLVGGIGEGISDSLPKIGENLSKFAESIKPMFTMFQGVDMSGVGSFFSALGRFMIQMGGEKLLSFFTGGTNLGNLGTELTAFANNASEFFTKVATIPANGFENAKLFFNSLAGVNSLPKEGGIAQWFTGTINYENLANGLGQLSNEKVLGFFSAVANIPQASFEQAKLFFNALAEVKGLPEEGGLKQWFTGTINYESLANGLGQLSSEKVIGFFTAVANIPQVAFEQTKLMFAALAEIKGLPEEGGLKQWFTGDSLTTLETLANKLPTFGEAMAQFYNSISGISDFSKISQLFEALSSINQNVEKKGGGLNWIKEKISGSEETALEALGSGLKQFGENAKDFFTQINGLNLDNLNGLWESLKQSEGITADSLAKVGQNIDDIVAKVTELPKKMGDGIKSAGVSLSEALVYIWQEAAKAMASPVNKVIEGANWILKEFGSDKRVASWTPYARGTDGHKGGNAIVNDGRGAEIVQMPNGRTFIPQGRNVFMPNAPKGMKVLPAEQTAKLLGKKSPTFHYAGGIGDIDLFSYFDNASGLVEEIKKTISYDRLSGIALNAGKGMVNTITSAMPAWVEKQFDEFGGRSLASYVSTAGVEQWRSTVIQALRMIGQYSQPNVERTLYQMKTESGGNPMAINLWDSNAKKGIPSKGLMQVIDPTFRAYAMPGFDSNIYDPLSNILASVRYAVSRYGSLANAYRGRAYANGTGTVELPSYTPENGGKAVVNSRNSAAVENNTYAPQFSIVINGAEDTRSMERKVKRFIQEALDDVFSSMAAKARV